MRKRLPVSDTRINEQKEQLMITKISFVLVVLHWPEQKHCNQRKVQKWNSPHYYSGLLSLLVACGAKMFLLDSISSAASFCNFKLVPTITGESSGKANFWLEQSQQTSRLLLLA